MANLGFCFFSQLAKGSSASDKHSSTGRCSSRPLAFIKSGTQDSRTKTVAVLSYLALRPSIACNSHVVQVNWIKLERVLPFIPSLVHPQKAGSFANIFVMILLNMMFFFIIIVSTNFDSDIEFLAGVALEVQLRSTLCSDDTHAIAGISHVSNDIGHLCLRHDCNAISGTEFKRCPGWDAPIFCKELRLHADECRF